VGLKQITVATDTAMIKKRRIRIISISEQRVVVISRGFSPGSRWCDACVAEARMVTPAEAAALAQVNMRTIYRWIEAGRVHFTEEPEGALLVCVGSLLLNTGAM